MDYFEPTIIPEKYMYKRYMALREQARITWWKEDHDRVYQNFFRDRMSVLEACQILGIEYAFSLSLSPVCVCVCDGDGNSVSLTSNMSHRILATRSISSEVPIQPGRMLYTPRASHSHAHNPSRSSDVLAQLDNMVDQWIEHNDPEVGGSALIAWKVPPNSFSRLTTCAQCGRSIKRA
jgi:hypothetical protein